MCVLTECKLSLHAFSNVLSSVDCRAALCGCRSALCDCCTAFCGWLLRCLLCTTSACDLALCIIHVLAKMTLRTALKSLQQRSSSKCPYGIQLYVTTSNVYGPVKLTCSRLRRRYILLDLLGGRRLSIRGKDKRCGRWKSVSGRAVYCQV